MSAPQEEYDDAMFHFSRAEYEACAAKLVSLLLEHPDCFDAQLALGMVRYRQGNYEAAIAEGHKAEQLRPKEQLVHTNLSLFYLKAGDKQKAEHHGLQARIAGWRENLTPPAPGADPEPELQIAQPKPTPIKTPPVPARDMPWKKKPPAPSGDTLTNHDPTQGDLPPRLD